MTNLSRVSVEELQEELRIRQSEEAKDLTPADPLHALIVQSARERFEQAHAFVAVAEQRAREEAQTRAAELELAQRLTPSQIPVTVSIDDPYDQLYPPGKRGSRTVTGHGLAATVRQAERDYAREAGHVRTDGALGYRVTAKTPSGAGVQVPDELWLPFSEQTAESMAKRRETDERRRW